MLGISAPELTIEKMKEIPVESIITDPEAPSDAHEYSEAFLRGDDPNAGVVVDILITQGAEAIEPRICHLIDDRSL